MYMMNKLDEREKKLAEEKLYKDDSNRKFVIEEAHNFLRELPEVTPTVNKKEEGVNESASENTNTSLFETKETKQLNMFVVDPGSGKS